MEELKVRLHMHWHGVEEDEITDIKERAQNEYLALYNEFTKIINSVIDKINEVWKKHESIRASGDFEAAMMSAYAMMHTIKDDFSYEDWIEKWYKQVCIAVDQTAEMYHFIVRSNIFRDGDIPVFGVKLKDRPEVTLDFTLEPID